jgi:hypothetical protein
VVCNGAINTPLQQERGCVFCVVHAKELAWRQLVLQFSWEFRCGVLTSRQQHDHGRWRLSIVQICYQETSSENVCRGIAIVESCHQAMTSESRLRRLSMEWFVVWKSAIVLQLFVVTTCKWFIKLFTNPYPVYSHSKLWQYLYGVEESMGAGAWAGAVDSKMLSKCFWCDNFSLPTVLNGTDKAQVTALPSVGLLDLNLYTCTVNSPLSVMYGEWDIQVVWLFWFDEKSLQKSNFHPFLVFYIFSFSVSKSEQHIVVSSHVGVFLGDVVDWWVKDLGSTVT